jgi:TetR/AcrR family fatty acid metabolism transcriptional regulator
VASAETPPARPRKREEAPRAAGDKRDRILRAAVKVFARKGFYASRVSEIARAAGVADGTIYLYFKSKDELLTSLFEDRMVRLLERMRRAAEDSPRAADRLRAVLELQLGLLAEERDLAEVITVNLRQSTRFLKQFATRRFGEYLELMASLVADGQRAGEFRGDLSPRVVARALFGALDGVAMTWALGNGDPESLRRASTQVAELFLRGLVAPDRASA